MRVEQTYIKELIKDPDNARSHGERNIQAIEQSLAAFGQQKPIVINKEDTIIAGNGTLQAARQIGWETIQVVRTELPEHEQRAFAIADNRSAEMATWDEEVLAKTIEQLAGIDQVIPKQLGFDDSEIERLMKRLEEEEELEAPDWANTDSEDSEAGVQKVMLTFTTSEFEQFEHCIGMLKESHGIVDTTSAVIAAIEEVCGHEIK